MVPEIVEHFQWSAIRPPIGINHVTFCPYVIWPQMGLEINFFPLRNLTTQLRVFWIQLHNNYMFSVLFVGDILPNLWHHYSPNFGHHCLPNKWRFKSAKNIARTQIQHPTNPQIRILTPMGRKAHPGAQARGCQQSFLTLRSRKPFYNRILSGHCIALLFFLHCSFVT